MSTTYGSRSAFSGDFASRLTTSYTISAARPALFRAAVVLKRSGAAGWGQTFASRSENRRSDPILLT